MTGDGPVLIDWDTTGPESIPLEAAYVFTKFAIRGRDTPDPQLIRRSHHAYVAAGGTPLVVKSGLLDRRIGYHLAGIAGALGSFFDTRDDAHAISDWINQLPAAVANARAWEQLLRY